MLIECNRHTKEDLELWKEYEEIDLLNYKLNNVERKEKEAIRIIKEFKPDYASISWGKDSTVLAHLCYRSGLNIPFVWVVVEDIVNFYCFNVRDKFLKQFEDIIYDEIHIDRWFDGQFWRALGTLEKGFKQACEKFGKRYVSGIRAEEAPLRKIVMKIYGDQTENTCRPLGWWRTSDIFAYLKHYNLPVHSNYGMLGGGRYKRDDRRVASFTIKGYDKTLWDKEYYGDILNKLRWDKIH